ncbi:Extracellular exo-alpha-(1-_5)-L-arabinofuranosidase [Cyphellophora attinorum]|uniref:Extracellular exo-alpha-(1->5)-L-arabinofuranosidase n=1 Tax=Cyphellophora attinorum TaxID=1664694 RepID=A0A0N1HLL0_9EURO|nr:Extracellular exo-alpha-(1->5)-L-arabinofuranosidase [Phialophora attinorum]KPI37943.1 Extracellular exo-alpha-(1->5)-L-arabinofuranosidase [Phialophora attinorum]
MLPVTGAIFTAAAWLVGAQWTAYPPSNTNATYTNPILDGVGADPFVVKVDGLYYMTYTTGTNITILRSPILTDWNTADIKLAFTAVENTSYAYSLWAPELHNIDDRWYVIFTGNVDNESPSPEQDMYCDFNCPAVNHRMFTLESSGSDIWESEYAFKAQLDTYDQFAIDGTYFQHSSGLYHIYSCWHSAYVSWPAMLCITKMSNPYTVSSPLSERLIISKPDEPWEKTPYNRTVNVRLSSNEGPQQLNNPTTNQSFVIYSAARSDNRNYCLGLLELTGPDPLSPDSWTKNNASCVFYQNPEESVYGVGHASFVTSPDESQWWIVYHGMRDYATGWSARTIRTQDFGWDEVTGWPVFPRPGEGPFEVPSGQV